MSDFERPYAPQYNDSILGELGFTQYDTGSGIVYDVSPSDTIAITDAMAYDPEVSDTVSLTDSLSRDTFFERSGTDTVSVTDANSIEVSKTLSDTVSVADDISVTLSSSNDVVLSDTISITDSLVYEPQLSDTVSLTDSTLLSFEYGRTPSDTVSITDSTSVGIEVALTTSDSVSVTDTIAAGRDIAVVLSTDSVVTDDSVTLGASFLDLVFNDTLAVTDSLAPVTSYDRYLDGDVIFANDDRSLEVTYTRALGDTLSVTESLFAELAIDPSDALVVADSVLSEAFYEWSASDTISTTDFSDTDIIFPQDAITVTDTLATVTQYERSGSDSLSITDVIAPDKVFERAGSDNLVLTDSTFLEKAFPVDSVSVTDNLVSEAIYERTSNDALDLTESLSREAQFERTLSDSSNVTDTVTAIRDRLTDVSLSDSLTVTETTLAEYIIGRSASDFIDINDFVVRAVSYVRDSGTDALAISEALVVGSFRYMVFNETLTVTDSLLVEPITGRSASDTVSVTDSVSYVGDFERILSESLTITDVVVVGQTYNKDLSDTVAVTDTVTSELNLLQLDVTDSIFDVTDSASRAAEFAREVNETLAVTDTVAGEKGGVVDRTGTDTLAVTDIVSYIQDHTTYLLDTVSVSDLATVELKGPVDITLDTDGHGFTIGLASEIRYDNLGNLHNYVFRPFGGVPFKASDVTPITTELANGAEGQVVYQNNPNFFSNVFRTSGSDSEGSATVVGKDVSASESFSIYDSYSVEVLGASPVTHSSAFTGGSVGDYIKISNGASAGTYRITGYVSASTVTLDRNLPVVDSDNGSLQWSWTTAIQSLAFKTDTKVSNQSNYSLSFRGLVDKDGDPFAYDASFFTYGIAGPAVESVELTDDGVVVVTYDQEMQADHELVFPEEYAITGPTDVAIVKTWSTGPKSVALQTLGLSSGSYSLRVNASGTPKDIAGNPIDPIFNEAAFTGSTPLNIRSIFTDKGPIARAPEVVQSGKGAVLETVTETTLPGATLTGAHVGLYVRLGFMGTVPTSSSSVVGTDVTVNDTLSIPDSLRVELSGGHTQLYTTLQGIYKITSVVSSTRARLQASFSLPNPMSGQLYWELLDPKNGEVADDPSDVTVTVNGAVVAAEAVVGLLGQVVLPFIPAETDDVKIDYSWCCEPVVDFRRLNSKEFRLNSWKRDMGYSDTQHKYRYNNVLVKPSEYVALDMLAEVDQPKLRELHYRAYERAYTPVLNDPSLLLLNSPTHKIAFPPSQRELEQEFVAYEAVVLPENDSWVKHGSGAASTSAGVLTVIDNQAGPFPTGQPLFWTKEIDLTFPNVFAMSWRFRITDVPTFNGVFTGVAAGYSDQTAAYVVGFLEDAGVKKIGILKRGSGDNPSNLSDWIGGVDSLGVSTGAPAEFDWSILHSYRIFTDRNGVVRVFVDGDIAETLRISLAEAPFLEELGSPFDEIQGAFFGSLSREAENKSEWDFVRYQVIPTNALQSSPSSFVDYDASVVPEETAKPWIPIGFHGTETILTGSSLLLDSTSATDPSTASAAGFIGGDFKGLVRIEPLLTEASQYDIDVVTQLRTHTHGPDPYGLMFGVDDGSFLAQLALFPDFATPKVSYGGRSFPEDFSPYVWGSLGGATASMVGRHLRIDDASVGDGKVYFIDDLAPPSSDARILASSTDYVLEFRAKVNTFTVDGSGFAGVFGQTFDSTRAVGLMLQVVSGIKYVAFHSDGVPLGPSARFAFDWNDGNFHTYRFIKNTGGDLVSLFIDGAFKGSAPYSSFSPSGGDAQVSFGSSTPASSAALSNVDWVYCNSWRIRSDQKRFAGLWKGHDSDSLLGYHLPLKAFGKGAQVAGNGLGDAQASFISAGVAIGDYLIVDYGDNKGVYQVAGVGSATTLTISGTWAVQPTFVDYRIVRETDWSTSHKYRISKNPSGAISVFLDTALLFEVDYSALNLPSSGTGFIKAMTGGLAGVAFGSFSSENLEQSNWDSVSYGITRTPITSRIVPHHQVLNQWNVMESPERLYSALPHELTSFKSSSTGIVPKKDPDFLEDAGLTAFTLLNEDTPLVPSTQTYQVRDPHPTQYYLSVLNSPEDVLNNEGDFVLNDATSQYRLVVPKDILYSALDVIEQTTGEDSLIAPFGDECEPTFSGLQYTKETCLTYEADVLPENDTAAPTPWVLESDVPGEVTTTISSGILTYSSTASKTVYKNNTTLPDAPGLITKAKFRVKVTEDQTFGTGDTNIRLGLSAPQLTVGLAFVTSPLSERYILVVDLNSGNTLGSISFDYLDGAFHDYLITRDPGQGIVRVSIDS